MLGVMTARVPTRTADISAAPVLQRTAAGWHPDPEGAHRLRYHDGRGYTAHTTHFGPVPCQGCGHLA